MKIVGGINCWDMVPIKETKNLKFMRGVGGHIGWVIFNIL